MWGFECIIDAKDCDVACIQSIENIQGFIDELILKTDMKKMGPLHSFYLGDNEYNRSKDIVGYSICQFIQTSSIVAHFCETSKTMYLNFFSCKPFDTKDVKDLVTKYFKTKSMKDFYLTRDAN